MAAESLQFQIHHETEKLFVAQDVFIDHSHIYYPFLHPEQPEHPDQPQHHNGGHVLLKVKTKDHHHADKTCGGHEEVEYIPRAGQVAPQTHTKQFEEHLCPIEQHEPHAHMGVVNDVVLIRGLDQCSLNDQKGCIQPNQTVHSIFKPLSVN